MDKSVIKDLIAENQDFIEKVSVLPRNVSLERQGNYVYVTKIWNTEMREYA